MWKMERTEDYSNKMEKRADIFNKTIVHVIPTGVPSHRISNFLPSVQNRTATSNVYYEEMKPLFIILRMFGLMPYHVSSKGKPYLVKFIKFDQSKRNFLCLIFTLFREATERVPSVDKL